MRFEGASSVPRLVQKITVFWNRTKALFFMGSKGHVRHSFGVFFAWHGLESCWCFGLFGSEADENLSSDRPESTLLAPLLVQKLAFFGPWSCQSIVFYRFQRSREAFFRRVFCLAWARILLVFRSFRIWGWREFKQRSSGIHAPGTPSGAKTRVLRALILLVLALFFMGSKGHVRHSFGVFFAWHGLESCWCFGLFGSEADENLSSDRPESTLLAPLLVQKLAFFGPWSCWCFGLFGSEADESLRSHSGVGGMGGSPYLCIYTAYAHTDDRI